MEDKKLNPTSEVLEPSALERWIEEAKKGDIGSYQKIYEMFSPRIFNFVYRMSRSTEEAEDITQETFIAVYQKLGTLKEDSKFESWLFRIARNFVYQKYRGRSPATISIDILDEEGQPAAQIADTRKDPDESFQATELGQVVERVIRALPEKYREVFVLAAIRHLSYQAIADIVGRSLASVKTDIHRARLEVRRQVKEYLMV